MRKWSFALSLLWATPALAQHEEAHGIDGMLLGATFVNFVILVTILVVMLRKPLMGYLQTRRTSIEKGLAEASSLKAEAEAKYEEYKGRLATLDQELGQLRAEMIRLGESERDRIIAEAEQKASRMRKDTELLIEQQVKQLREDLAREAIEAAVSGAALMLADRTTADDQTKLAQDYLLKLPRLASPAPNARKTSVVPPGPGNTSSPLSAGTVPAEENRS